MESLYAVLAYSIARRLRVMSCDLRDWQEMSALWPLVKRSVVLCWPDPCATEAKHLLLHSESPL